MNKEFMEEFYRKFYDDPVYEVLGETENYKKFVKDRKRAEEKLRAEIGGIDSSAWKLFEAYMKIQYNHINDVALAMYLQGAEDRDRMLE